MLGEAVGFPKRGDSWLKTILIGGILSLLSFLIIPAFFLQGYFLRVLAAGAREDPEPPTFSDWGDLFVTGLLFIVIAIGYFIVPTVLLVLVTVIVGVGTVASGGPPDPSVVAGAGIASLLVLALAVLIYLLAAYLLPAAATNYAVTGELGAAFRFGTVFEMALTADYAVGWLLAIIVGIVFGVVGAALSVIIVGIFITFYGQMATYYLLGNGAGRSGAVGGSRAAVAE
ncbi:DUF4013 domain-containing protein [Natronomonas sp. EA1]|uniref:DUF4013 domain-containing protein n=1 Tax=Natronomonas sp. EA1 TaxID=3421655 RepID=UPI003EB88520